MNIFFFQFLHIFTNLSFPPLMAFSPPIGDQSTAYTSSECPGKSNINFYLDNDHNFRVESLDAESNILESLDHATLIFYGIKYLPSKQATHDL
jgi:hypothetical protein